MGKNKRRWLLIGLLGLGVAVGLGVWLTRTKKGPRVEAYQPVRQPLAQTLVTSGRVVQRQQSALGAMIQSTVVEAPVEEGDEVEADALLLRLADEEAQAALAEAEAAVAEAEARLARVSGVGRRMATASLQQARIDAEQAQSEYERQRRLFESGAVSEAALQRAQRDRDATRSRRVSASIDVAASSPGGSDAQALAAALRRAQARLRNAEVGVQRTQIRAPTAGTVLIRHVQQGEVVRPGEPLITFAGDAPLQVLVRPDESNLARIETGQSALVSPEAFPDRRLSAELSRIAPSVDRTRGTIEVELSLTDAPDDLRPGMTVTVEIEVGRSEDALVLPSELVRDLESERPWVLVHEDGRAERKPVEIGLEGDELVEITGGLDEEDAVLSPEAAVMEGDPVRVRRVVPAAG